MTCLYCGKYLSPKKAAIEHVNRFHSKELERDGYDAPQSLYMQSHGTLNGRCQICGKETAWNYKTGKPYRMCPSPECRKKNREIAVANGADGSLLQSMEFQKSMQQNRRIGGVYQFQDGGKVDYLANLELSWLKFCDKIMDLPSWTIQSPPENFKYYDPKDKKWHTYMPDYYMPDYNLMVEIKHGGDHPNTNPAYVETTGYKVALKDEVMRKQNKYNYIRISGTNYGPFMEMLYQIVHEQKGDGKKRNALVVITESACADPDEEEIVLTREVVDPSRIRLMVGYEKSTNMVRFTAITDSMYMASWYVYNVDDGSLTQRAHDDEIFHDCDYKIYKYIGDGKLIADAFRHITCSERYDPGDGILDILESYGIWFDDHITRNNDNRKCSFVLVEEFKEAMIDEHDAS